MSVNDDLLDLSLRHEIEVRRFARGVEKRILAILAKSDDALRTRMISALQKVDAVRFGVRDLSQLAANVKRDVARGMTAAEDALIGELAELAEHETEWQRRAINAASPIAFSINMPEPINELSWDGKTLESWFRALDRNKSDRLAAVVRLGLSQGSTSEQMSRAVAEGFEISRHHSRTLIRTSVTAAGTQARQALLDSNADIIKGVKWIATLDGRTSKICGSRDGRIYPVNRGPRPPAHPNCRSVVVPVLKSWKDLGLDELDGDDRLSERPFVRDRRRVKDIPKHERDQLIGTTRASETYQDWLKRQPAAFVDDVLGQTKGALFRRGGLKLDRFVDESGKEFTIQELRRREAAAFKRAGV